MKRCWGLCMALWLCAGSAWAADLSITADELSYDGNAEVATASGNVVIERDGAKMTGTQGEYHFSDGSATLTGGVEYHKGNTSLTAATVYAYADQSLRADGDVHIVDGDKELLGAAVTYRPSDGYGTVEGGGVLRVPGTEMRAAAIEAHMNEIRLVGTGGVQLVSSQHGLRATADKAIYTQTPGQDDGFVSLVGNAHAEQNGNTLNGPHLDIRVADNAVETKGRSTLVIRSREK